MPPELEPIPVEPKDNFAGSSFISLFVRGDGWKNRWQRRGEGREDASPYVMKPILNCRRGLTGWLRIGKRVGILLGLHLK